MKYSRMPTSEHLMKKYLAIFAFAIALAPIAASADDTITADRMIDRYYNGDASEKALIAATLSNIENGFGWANADLISSRHEAPLYCPPQNIVPTGDQLMEMERRHVKKMPAHGKAPFDVVLLVTLKEAFPCK